MLCLKQIVRIMSQGNILNRIGEGPPTMVVLVLISQGNILNRTSLLLCLKTRNCTGVGTKENGLKCVMSLAQDTNCLRENRLNMAITWCSIRGMIQIAQDANTALKAYVTMFAHNLGSRLTNLIVRSRHILSYV